MENACTSSLFHNPYQSTCLLFKNDLPKDCDCMKNILYSLVCLAMVLVLLPIPVFAANPSVIVADYKVTPSVLQPGDIGTITATIKNTASMANIRENIQSAGSETITSTDINVNIESVQLESKDVEVISGNYKQVGEIGPGQSIPITFLIRAPAQDGIYFPEIWIDVTGGESVRQPIPVNVNTQIALLKKPAITVSKTIPDSVNPGDDFPVRVILENNGLSGADEIVVSVNSSTSTIAPKTPNNYHFDRLSKGEKVTLDMNFATDKNAPLGLSPVTLTIRFANADGSYTTQTETLGIPIKGKADIGIASLSTDPEQIKKGDPVNLIIRLENTGTDNANSVKASIDLPMSGGKEAYVGKIEPNNDAPAVFSLQAGDPGNYAYNLTVEYQDDYGMHTKTERLTMTVLDGDSSGLILLILLLVIGAGAGYWYFVLRKKGTGNA
jgi:hypothetical protein